MPPSADQGPRSQGISYDELLDTDPFPVPESLRARSMPDLGNADIDAARYVDRRFHDLEVERLWSRVWQFACRVEQLPEVGSHVVYDIASMSFIVVRTGEDEFKAYVNSCLHRGRQLKDQAGRSSSFRCPYHGFDWNLDGSLKLIPAEWDFEHVEPAEFCLPEAKVGVWAGFVFINPDTDGAPDFEDWISGLAEHFERWDMESRFIEVHVHKIIRANWKITQEAFCESYHVGGTHPQASGYLGDVNSQVDVWDNFSRIVTPGGTASPLLGWEPTEEEILRYMLDIREDEDSFVTLGDHPSAREASAAAARERWRKVVGDQVDTWSDSEFLDNIDYTLFPNFHPWGAYNRICYRFRPNGDDHETSIMEVYLLSPFKGERPPPAHTTYLGPDDDWTAATELGMLAKVFQQDSFNMPMVHKGLKARRKPGVTLANYQEAKVRWLQQTIAAYLGEVD